MRPQVLSLTVEVAAMLNKDHGYEYPVSGDAIAKVRRKTAVTITQGDTSSTVPYTSGNTFVSCCLCGKQAEWAHHNSLGVFINTYCNNHRPL